MLPLLIEPAVGAAVEFSGSWLAGQAAMLLLIALLLGWGVYALTMRNGKTVASGSFFQSQSPKECGNCREHGTVNFDFRLPLSAVSRGKLQVGIELTRQDRISKWFPLSSAGNPTINIRHLLENE